ncbi:MAG: AAA family ATPase [Silicimonas sp.]|nr:AAA family ATPase [Silicimonas sp.]
MTRKRGTNLPAPFLRRLTLIADRMGDRKDYPMNLPWLDPEAFEIGFESPVTILVGENGSGKSTLIEAIAALAGYDEAGGGKGYRPVDHSRALDTSGAALGDALRGAWLPKVTDGWFFRAESFFAVARHLDEVAQDVSAAAPDFLSWSHGEGFVRFFEERMGRQGIYMLDEPESALSPKRQLDLLRVLAGLQESARSQVIMATHSPLLMAVPGAQVLEMTRRGPMPIAFEETEHFRLYTSFMAAPTGFIAAALAGEDIP